MTPIRKNLVQQMTTFVRYKGPSVPPTIRCAIMLTLAVGPIGCGGIGAAMAPLFMYDRQHLDGTWTGRIVSVDVHDQYGRTFQAAALAIEDGPEPGRVFGEIGADRGGAGVCRCW